MTQPSAGARVSHIVELLEHILLNVCDNNGAYIISDRDNRQRTILLSQRVSKAFRATIQGSRKLREALLLKHSIITPRPKDPINGLIFFKKIPIPGAVLRVGWTTRSIGAGGSPTKITLSFTKTKRASGIEGYCEASWKQMYLMTGDYEVDRLLTDDRMMESTGYEWRNARLGDLYNVAFGKD